MTKKAPENEILTLEEASERFDIATIDLIWATTRGRIPVVETENAALLMRAGDVRQYLLWVDHSLDALRHRFPAGTDLKRMASLACAADLSLDEGCDQD